MTENLKDQPVTTPNLEPIAMAALEAGRLLMEAGASARGVEEIVATVALGLGVDRVDLRIGYASLAITIGIGDSGITRMRKVGHIGVNQSLDQELRHLAQRVECGGMTAADVEAEMDRLVKSTPRHSRIVMAIAVGLACASFGRLLKVDWAGTGPVFLAATIGQYIRRELAGRHFNPFLNASFISFVSSVLGGIGARLAGSNTVATAMIASILLLVPGVPSLNAQNDILEGRPTLGSARAVWVAVILIFITAGLWLGQVVIAEGR
ncbi:MAG TPA: threonine/serine exporter family protein [Candidatus Paceibacterota bacterium]|nr:threonine/serine exporter family protein [Candidatus Paceibacterota bacterium]